VGGTEGGGGGAERLEQFKDPNDGGKYHSAHKSTIT